MKPAPFRYERADTLNGALDRLGEEGERIEVLAGGQSLLPLLNARERRPEVVLDITRLAGLGQVTMDSDAMTVGALVTQYDLGEHDGIDDLVRECLPFTGHYATRHRGTIGGSIAHGEPRGELPLALLTLGGSVRVRARGGERDIPAEDVYVGPYRTTLRPDELIVSSSWPRASRGEGRAFAELAHRQGDLTLAAAACAVATADGEIVGARVGVGAVADRPLLVGEAAQALIGRRPGAAAAEAAAAATRAAVLGYDDHYASADYRRHLAGVLVMAASLRAMGRAGG